MLGLTFLSWSSLVHCFHLHLLQAWGGNAYIFGGEIDGGKILGKYPESFANTDPTNIGRGRLIPAVSWESMWYGIANWFGITDSKEIDYVLPNNGNMGCQLYSDKDLYRVGNSTVPGCNDRVVGMKLSMFIKEPRYLTVSVAMCSIALFLNVKTEL